MALEVTEQVLLLQCQRCHHWKPMEPTRAFTVKGQLCLDLGLAGPNVLWCLSFVMGAGGGGGAAAAAAPAAGGGGGGAAPAAAEKEKEEEKAESEEDEVSLSPSASAAVDDAHVPQRLFPPEAACSGETYQQAVCFCSITPQLCLSIHSGRLEVAIPAPLQPFMTFPVLSSASEAMTQLVCSDEHGGSMPTPGSY